MPRLFTGLEIPPIQRSQLALLQTGLRDVRWIEPGDMHITLRFIGDVSPVTATAIVEALSSRDWTTPEIQIGELSTFGSKKPTSLYASVASEENLSTLAAGHERLMQQIGLSADGRKFTPHVTLARCRSAAAPQLAKWLAHYGGFSAPAFTASRFALFSARDSTGGGPYVVEQTWSLKNSDSVPD